MKEELTPILPNLLQITEDEVYFPINFMRPVLPNTKIRQRQYKKKENYRPVSYMTMM